MAWPSTISSYSNPIPTDRLNNPSHSSVETAQNIGLTELQTYIGVTTGANASAIGTLLYDIKAPGSNGGGHVQTVVKGGTGQTTYTKGDILVAESSSVLTKLSTGGAGESLISTPGTAVGVSWGSVAGVSASVISYVPHPNFLSPGVTEMPIVSSTLGRIGQVQIGMPILASTLSMLSGTDTTGPVTLDITLYAENGNRSILTATTTTVNAPNTVFTASLGIPVNVPAGNYYVMVNPNGTADMQVTGWNPATGTPSALGLSHIAGYPVLQGTYNIAGGSPPSSIVTNAITSVKSGGITTVTNTLYFRIN